MLKKARARLVAVGAAAAALALSVPAEARYYVVYWADYPGGTVLGIFEYADGGALCNSWGSELGLVTYFSEPGVPCGPPW